MSPAEKPGAAAAKPAASAKPAATAKPAASDRGRAMASPVPDDHVIVLFGATGDLAKRKLLPGLFHLAKAGLMPKNYRVIGSSPTKFELSDDGFRKHAK